MFPSAISWQDISHGRKLPISFSEDSATRKYLSRHASHVTIPKHIFRWNEVALCRTQRPAAHPPSLPMVLSSNHNHYTFFLSDKLMVRCGPPLRSRSANSQLFVLAHPITARPRGQVSSLFFHQVFTVCFFFQVNASGLMINVTITRTLQSKLHRRQPIPVLGSSTNTSRGGSGPSMSRPPIA